MSDAKKMMVLVAVQAVLVAAALSGLCYGAGGTMGPLSTAEPDVSDAGESAESRAARLAEIAAAIDAAGRTRVERALLIAVGRRESNWARATCSGELLGDHGRAYGCWQSWHPDRTGGIPEQARRAARHLRFGLARCGTPRGALSLYATGNRCEWAGVDNRLAYFHRVLARL